MCDRGGEMSRRTVVVVLACLVGILVVLLVMSATLWAD
jgi:hypothetical protein